MSYVYISVDHLPGMFGEEDHVPNWQVGFYLPKGTFCADSFWDSRHAAAAQVSYLNGGSFNTYEGCRV